MTILRRIAKRLLRKPTGHRYAQGGVIAPYQMKPGERAFLIHHDGHVSELTKRAARKASMGNFKGTR